MTLVCPMVSGDQTGADQGGWDSAIHCDPNCGGWVPEGRKTGAGVIPALDHGQEAGRKG